MVIKVILMAFRFWTFSLRFSPDFIFISSSHQRERERERMSELFRAETSQIISISYVYLNYDFHLIVSNIISFFSRVPILSWSTPCNKMAFNWAEYWTFNYNIIAWTWTLAQRLRKIDSFDVQDGNAIRNNDISLWPPFHSNI